VWRAGGSRGCRLRIPPCPHTRICSALNRSWSGTGCWRTWKCFCATRNRLADCRKRLNVCPLGSGAVAGATLPLDRGFMADSLGFDGADGEQHRRHQRPGLCAGIRQRAFAARPASEPLGGGDDSFSSQEYGFLGLPEAYSTGSSAMPQKKNPDLLELVRGKSGRVLGNANRIDGCVKGCHWPTTRTCRKRRSLCSTPPTHGCYRCCR
jgi:hypothetical protein